MRANFIFKQLQKSRQPVFVVPACHQPVLDGFNQHFLVTVHFPQTSAINKYQQHLKKLSWECRELNPRPLGDRQECYHCTMQPPADTLCYWRQREIRFPVSYLELQDTLNWAWWCPTLEALSRSWKRMTNIVAIRK